MNYRLKKLKPYLFNLTVSLNKPDLDYYTDEAQKYLANELKIDGLRGKAPKEIAGGKLDKNKVLETAFNLAFRQSFSEVVLEEKISLIEVSNFQVKENQAEKLVYSILLTVFPEFKLCDYRKVLVKKNKVSVQSQELERTLNFIRNSRKKDGEAPELTDEFAQSLGDFKNLKSLKDSISSGLKQEKEMKESQRLRMEILSEISQKTKLEIPQILVERQLDRMMTDFDADLHREGKELGLFLAQIKKTAAQLRSDWKLRAADTVKKALILKKIAETEKIKVEPAEVKKKVSELIQNFATIEDVEKKIDLPELSQQIEQIILNEKVLTFLEKENSY